MRGPDLDWVDGILAAICFFGGFILGAVAFDDGPDIPDEMDKRYQECLAAGGSFSKNDVDWSCNQP